MMYSTAQMIAPTSAPIPTTRAVFGFVSFQTRKRTSPTTGRINPRKPHPNPPLSTTAGFVSCGTPHLGQIIARLSICDPQFLQYAISLSHLFIYDSAGFYSQTPVSLTNAKNSIHFFSLLNSSITKSLLSYKHFSRSARRTLDNEIGDIPRKDAMYR